MALINCYECGGKVSTTAKACPHCGAPIEVASKKRLTPPPFHPSEGNINSENKRPLKPEDQIIVDRWVKYYSNKMRKEMKNPWNLPFFIGSW